ncbi:hypothetical protein Q3G72_004121 [Acer saccharum]|nr:hypothetical protein Q3G72_004121 [Acer saccharum]
MSISTTPPPSPPLTSFTFSSSEYLIQSSISSSCSSVNQRSIENMIEEEEEEEDTQFMSVKQKEFLLFIDLEEPTPRWLMATDTMHGDQYGHGDAETQEVENEAEENLRNKLNP